ncbi:turripeptide Pal9.2 [Drosophila ficusphila]|uniref:turripeptide Pal9.2 n=1 Tax=Drosophila ficusphila TaxID=30025 RepID=UPI0007E760CA|nr:turripeptide Pal9.2 [Drosophila ficusphila]
MKCVAIFAIISLALMALVKADGRLPCPRACTRDFRPVCAEWRRGVTRVIVSTCTFPNRCTLDNQRCRTGQNWVIVNENRRCKRDTNDCRELLDPREN